MRVLIAMLCVVAGLGSAHATEITITLSLDEQRAFVKILAAAEHDGNIGPMTMIGLINKMMAADKDQRAAEKAAAIKEVGMLMSREAQNPPSLFERLKRWVASFRECGPVLDGR